MVRGDNMKLGLCYAAGCHFIMAAFDSLDFSVLSCFVVLFMAECKLRLCWAYELVPPVYPSVNLFAAPVYVMNAFVDRGYHWKYTDKVWKSVDVVYPVVNAIGAVVLRRIYAQYDS